MTKKQADDFRKWVGHIELVPYMEDNNIEKLEDVTLERAVEEADHTKYVASNWLDYYDIGSEEYKECMAKIRGSDKFLKKYKGVIQGGI